MITNNRIFKLSTLAFAMVSSQYAHSAVTGTFATGAGNGGAMDKEYVNNYPYSRCSDETIPSDDCKEFGYVFGDDPMRFGDLKALFLRGSHADYNDEMQYTADMVTDNYAVPDTFNWILPSSENIQYAVTHGLLKTNTYYPYWSDDGDHILIEEEIFLATLPSTPEPTELDDDTQVVGLLVAVAYGSDGNPIDDHPGGSPGLPGEPGESTPNDDDWHGYDPNAPVEPEPDPTPDPTYSHTLDIRIVAESSSHYDPLGSYPAGSSTNTVCQQYAPSTSYIVDSTSSFLSDLNNDDIALSYRNDTSLAGLLIHYLTDNNSGPIRVGDLNGNPIFIDYDGSQFNFVNHTPSAADLVNYLCTDETTNEGYFGHVAPSPAPDTGLGIKISIEWTADHKAVWTVSASGDAMRAFASDSSKAGRNEIYFGMQNTNRSSGTWFSSTGTQHYLNDTYDSATDTYSYTETRINARDPSQMLCFTPGDGVRIRNQYTGQNFVTYDVIPSYICDTVQGDGQGVSITFAP
ncbi:hypothetical protein L4C33_08300 [Vibrio makurazakiensis]|uniref:hypothetical protein n=1 Tax=Vibrio makurazakiensis TaxID=2910250 RepID=UPI003D14D186